MKLVLKIVAGLGIIIILVTVSMVVSNNRTPKNLGVHDGKLAEVPTSPNGISTQTSIVDKKIEPLLYKGTLEESKKNIENIIEGFEGAKIITNEKNYIHVVFSTKLMKYKDDAEFYFNKNKKIIEFRSASRIGKSDLGMNRKRYEEIKGLYQKIK